MRVGSTLHYLLSDHLGSSSITADSSGNKIAEMRYKAWGEVRFQSGTTPTDRTYTGQRSYVSDFGLMYYNARWYDNTTGRFAQADNIDVQVGDTQSLERFAYAVNNPIRYNDPSGHDIWDSLIQFGVGFLTELGRTNAWWHPMYQQQLSIKSSESDAMLLGRLAADIVSAGIAFEEIYGCNNGSRRNSRRLRG
jgi:RHS repeat-associated protein